MKLMNYQVVFAKHPGVNGSPAEDNFRYESCEYPADPAAGHVLVQNLYLSVDPAQRCQMNEASGADYLLPWRLDEPVPGLGGVGKVLSSNHADFRSGDVVMSGFFEWPWRLYSPSTPPRSGRCGYGRSEKDEPRPRTSVHQQFASAPKTLAVPVLQDAG
ncbi:prostaglandin reductase 2-like [Pollicipes pollicipes]|uniref:prostaglandin reductase 2-like n=1 Tax=Pollicipes pollicipes TaxID=41117 RepID=UPI0018859831|nr:prostaglandin reductase 2-like [Pollicipes pollicipes]